MKRILTCTGILGEGNALAFGAADILMSTMIRLRADAPVALPAREEAR